MTDGDLKKLVGLVDEVVGSTQSPTAHVQFSFTHELDDEPFPYLFDYIETLGCKVVHVFKVPITPNELLPAVMHCELLVWRPMHSRWDGSI